MIPEKKTRSELKREAIIQAAIKTFPAQGIQATTMDNIAEVAKVSKRTVYNHFESKESLVAYLLSDLWEKFLVQADHPYDPKQPLKEQLTEVLMVEVNLIGGEQYVDLARMVIGDHIYRQADFPQQIADILAEETMTHRWLRAAINDNRIREVDVSVAGEQLHNLIKGSALWPQLIKLKPILSDEEKRQLAENSAALFLSHYEIVTSIDL